MRKFWCMVCVTVMLFSVGQLYSGDPTGPATIVDKAIKAHGGEASLKKLQAYSLKGKGTLYFIGEGLTFTGEWFNQGTEQLRFNLEAKLDNLVIKYSKGIHRDKGWKKFSDQDTDILSKEEVNEEREMMHAVWLSTLLPLKDKGLKLAPLGEVKVGERATVGIRVSQQGRRDVSLFFDKTDGTLLKVEQIIKDYEQGGGKETKQEAFYSDYKDFDGVSYASRLVLKRDGKNYVDGQITAVTIHKKLEDGMFMKP